MKRLLFFTLFVSAVTLGGYWGGRQVCGMVFPGAMSGAKEGTQRLGLSPEQERSLKSLEEPFIARANRLCMKVCKEKAVLLELLADKKVDQKTIHLKIEEIGLLQISLEKEIVSHIFLVKTLLNEKQGEIYVRRIQKEFQDSMAQCGYSEIFKKDQ